jgi:hypothetical protein
MYMYIFHSASLCLGVRTLESNVLLCLHGSLHPCSGRSSDKEQLHHLPGVDRKSEYRDLTQDGEAVRE